MSTTDLSQLLGDSCYVFLTLNFLWGLYHLIMGFRRIFEMQFGSRDEQTEFMNELLGFIKHSQFDNAKELCEDDVRALPQLAEMAIDNRELEDEELRQLVAEVVQQDILGDLEYRTSWISTVIKSGPLLGLMGTVLGMMAAFGRIGTGEKVQPSQIADEISVALICTAMGLATAIPFNFLLASLNTRIRKFQDALSMNLLKVVDALSK